MIRDWLGGGRRRLPLIKEFMTRDPVTIPATHHLKTAKKVMGQHNFRHLPVMDGQQLVGVISDRDIKLAEAIYCERNPGETIRVVELCLFDPYVVDESARLDRVVEEIYERRIGSALITHNKKLTGIFTTTDACRVLAEFIRKR